MMLVPLVFLVVMGSSATLLGVAMLRVLDAEFVERVDRWAVSVLLGLGVLALGIAFLGVVGAMTRFWLGAWVLAPIVCLGPVWSARGWCGLPLDLVSPLRWLGFKARAYLNAGGWLLGVVMVGTFLTSLLPVTEGDALCYHLQVPKRFLQEGRLIYEPDLHETVYPGLVEMLYALGLSWSGPVACRLVTWLIGVAFVGVVVALARPVLGGRSVWAGLIAASAPAVSNGMSAPLNDVALAAFCTGALLMAVRWNGRPTLGRAALAGLFAGFGIGVKYPALVWVGMLGVFLAWGAVRARSFSHAVVFAGVLAVVGGWWYGRAYMCTGNPVFPFFKGFFGGAGLDVVLEPMKRPLSPSPINLLTFLWPMTLDPDRFDSVSHQFGPVFLMVLPGLVLLRAPRRVLGLAVFGFVFIALCLTQRQSMRFVLAALGPWSVVAGWVLVESWGGRVRAGRLAAVVLVAVLGAQGVLAVARARHGWRLLTGGESSLAYLSRREPTVVVGRWIGAHLPAEARVIGQDHRGFYVPRAYTMELAHRRRTGLGSREESAEDMVAELRRRGFTHLLLCPPEPLDAVEFDATLQDRLSAWLRARAPVYRQDLTDADGVLRHYALYALAEPGDVALAGKVEARR